MNYHSKGRWKSYRTDLRSPEKITAFRTNLYQSNPIETSNPKESSTMN